jgi:formylmethanofuran dehydrogenase subunit C
MPLLISSRVVDSLPISWRGLHPLAVVGKTIAEVERITIWYGNREIPWGEFFRFSGDTRDGDWRLEGDFSNVHYIGANLQQGTIFSTGPVGRHAASGMRGGRLNVSGAGDFLGAEMRGGSIVVTGDAGDHVGAAYVGSKLGMRGGTLVVHGNLGHHAGYAMRRGMLVAMRGCGDWPGYRMRGGTLVVGGACGERVGAELRRGTIIAAGAEPTPLPTYRYACRYRPAVIDWMHREMSAVGIAAPYTAGTEFHLFNGDVNEGGRGELLVACHSASLV